MEIRAYPMNIQGMDPSHVGSLVSVNPYRPSKYWTARVLGLTRRKKKPPS